VTAERTSPANFLALLKERERGRLKLYIGSAAGVGKTCRMLDEAHELRSRGIDAVIGFVETHNRADTAARLRDLEVVPRTFVEYRGIRIQEMDLAAVIARRPQVAIVDELAHTNVPGSRHAKRWQDVRQLLDEGISVISAMNVQHLESLNDVLERELGIIVRETVPDWLLAEADDVVYLDLAADDLRRRLTEGKIYDAEKVPSALVNFFTDENLNTLRELALREVAGSVDRARDTTEHRASAISGSAAAPRALERVMVCVPGSARVARRLLRKGTRIAGRLNSDWYCVHVRAPDALRKPSVDTDERAVMASMQLAQQLGADVVTLEAQDISAALAEFARAHRVALAVVGQSRRARSWWQPRRRVADQLVVAAAKRALALDVLVVPFIDDDDAPRGNIDAGGWM
jgi:two-component system sensor histidine kinase KdpD